MSSASVEQSTSQSLKEFGDRIRTQRKAQDLNQEQLAERVGISRVWLSKIERGRVPSLSLPLAEKITRALGLAPPFGLSTGPDKGTLPESLRRLAEAENLPEADVKMLSRIHYRGRQPTSARDWRILYITIQQLTDGEDTMSA